MASITFKPKVTVKHLLSVLPERAREVLTGRYGLGADNKRLTLEAIGKRYNITRERVRQIENHAVTAIRKSDAYKQEKAAFDELRHVIDELGGVVAEQELLEVLTKDEATRNHIVLLLVLGESFMRTKEDEECKTCWLIDTTLSTKLRDAMRKLYNSLSDEALVPESDLINSFLRELEDINEKYRNREVIKRWLSFSKTLGRNPLGEWGRAGSSNVHVKGMRDCAYLALKRHGSPMHFREVARAITQLFDKRAHEATTHNELIKDPRFVLVGRGLYALKEWGYSAGVVKDVIRDILRKHGPLTREEIIEKVKKERYVKDNTIAVNLQDSDAFRKSKEGRYSLVA